MMEDLVSILARKHLRLGQENKVFYTLSYRFWMGSPRMLDCVEVLPRKWPLLSDDCFHLFKIIY